MVKKKALFDECNGPGNYIEDNNWLYHDEENIFKENEQYQDENRKMNTEIVEKIHIIKKRKIANNVQVDKQKLYDEFRDYALQVGFNFL